MPEKSGFEILLEPFGIRLTASPGANLASFLREHGVSLRSDCGGKGVCGKCAVNVSVPGQSSAPPEQVLACSTEIHSDLLVDLPFASLINASEAVDKGTIFGNSPSKFKAAPRPGFGLAVDLGTTTIAGYLCDFSEGTALRSAILPNPQAVYGADVMSRIEAAVSGHLSMLQRLAVSAIDELAHSLTRSAGIAPEAINELLVVGNTTMLHLLLGVDPGTLGRSPFRPVFKESRQLAASGIGLTFNSTAVIRTLPVVSAFVGADLVSAAIAQDIAESADGTMLVDIGTNGEIILKANGGFYATSCATGPAFEGATIEHGMLALSGAIDSFKLNPGGLPEYTVIGQRPGSPVKARGICGSGLVSAAAELLRHGIIEPNGRFSPASVHPNLRNGPQGRREFVLAGCDETDTVDVVITQKDIRALQLAKGALSTGIAMLCGFAGCSLPGQILLAGSFGSHVAVEDLFTIGLLPPISREKVQIVGNAAGTGAVMAAMDSEVRKEAETFAEQIQAVELAAQPDFQTMFLNSLSFPGERRLFEAISGVHGRWRTLREGAER
jgi:uncharacterized 2Fe-2S/4Fe-4S cluster protein (DUF4445 family)